MNILLIGTDTPHRRFIINRLLDMNIKLNTCIFQKKTFSPKFKIIPKWHVREKNELKKIFKNKTRNDLQRVKKIIKVNNLSLILKKNKQDIQNADFIIISGADWIKGNLLKLIKSKSINVHMGIAEKYRGLDSNLWAWYHEDYKNMGVTLHELDHNLDTGKIFKKGFLNISYKTQVWLLRYHESNLATKLIISAINKFNTNKYVLNKQKNIGRYYSFMPAVIKNNLNITPGNK